ncbi:hypothetical protein HBI56_052330 [Parastagonospora nodorum]|uniref:Uncharacterized protein n=1 Tax=Phaeosphaeria nodorum (strain SN15 / ATCC MYA-4574 / FGSC 10173) TaxID=321614 RepID=A0A7U2ICR5_PHANO|nr:hypothetical protein HBH56_099820 [Parastagonospora nodorum]QRD07482.1 hypothetical protein JI435_131290 [Parastagonospora nodorum SN15]KAH3930566.1 hypothetical protein HBH54_114140 [Parastagonospora nodorum]KAH3942786.1 hypothetical protein HBH53_181820 [Parastagonospora nodorum]KAH3964603.1 hypothetical protein HBH51_157920 [Parastagonospora nodorum]
MSNNNNPWAQWPRFPKKPKHLSSSNATPLGRPRHHMESAHEMQRTSHSGVLQGTPEDDGRQTNVATASHNQARTPRTQASSHHTTAEEDQSDAKDAGVSRTGSPPPSPTQQVLSSPYVLSPAPSPTPSERYRAHRAQELEKKERRLRLERVERRKGLRLERVRRQKSGRKGNVKIRSSRRTGIGLGGGEGRRI